MTGDRLALATRVMRARRQSLCSSCRAPITVGSQIAKLTSPNGWCHIGCVPAVRAALDTIASNYPRKNT